MAYATQTDITTLYGEDALFVADRDRDGVADEAAVSRALEDASSEIDTYLAGRYDLPVDGAQPILRQLAVDIALYRLANAADITSETVRTRYEDAIATCKRLARGEQSLPMPGRDLDGDGEAEGPQPVVVHGPGRLFSRKSLRDY